MKYLAYPLGIGLILFLLAFAGRRWESSLSRSWRTLLAATAGCILLDGLALAALPWLGLSFGKVETGLLLFNGFRLLLILPLPFLVLIFSRRPGTARFFLVASLVVQFGLTAAELDGLYIEPFRLGTTQVAVQAPAFLPDRPLRVLHITDTHVERITKRERDLLEQVERARPDLIVLTGDYVNLDYVNDPQAIQDTRWLLAQLHAPYGVYASIGSVDGPGLMAALFDGLDIHVLKDQVAQLSLPGGNMYLVGITARSGATRSGMLSSLMKQVPPGGYTLLLYHTPDLVEAAPRNGVDLYLAGHTHGGQIRLPFYGAVITGSIYGKMYEMGEYHVGGTTMYVSRGIGMEGFSLPRMRFLCPPEIELFELGPQ